MAHQPLQVSSVTIAAPNPRELARFYQRLLGWTVSALEDPDPVSPRQQAGPSCGTRQPGRV